MGYYDFEECMEVTMENYVDSIIMRKDTYGWGITNR